MNENKHPKSPARTRGPDLILQPTRMRLVVALALKAGAAMTAAELQARMPDVPTATLYRHLNALRQGGIVGVADDAEAVPVPGPRRRGAVERRFVLDQSAASLGPADLAGATPDDHMRWFASFLASLLGAFGRYVAAGPPDLARDGVGYREVVIQLSDVELLSMAGALNAALLPFVTNPPADGRTARLFATVLLPADPPPADPAKGNAP